MPDYRRSNGTIPRTLRVCALTRNNSLTYRNAVGTVVIIIIIIVVAAVIVTRHSPARLNCELVADGNEGGALFLRYPAHFDLCQRRHPSRRIWNDLFRPGFLAPRKYEVP